MNFRAWKVGVGRGRLILLSNQKSNRERLLPGLLVGKVLLSSAAKRMVVGHRAVFVFRSKEVAMWYYHLAARRCSIAAKTTQDLAEA
jgi:hypothetical protein